MIFSRNATLLDACVLSALARGDTYGYELTARIRVASEVSESTLYPVLKRLQKEKLLSTYDEAVNGRNRRYYSLTESGRSKLAGYKEEWETFKQNIDRALTPGEGGQHEQTGIPD
ncbi:MAG: PadR family transcriptional regulator [Clostridiales bacterium]|jgi:PadR family transcriptional regulator PadR|nr:PadR family transcriptional regulator [Clostridiales bacterium]